MLPPEYLSSCSDQLIELYEELEDEIIGKMAELRVGCDDISDDIELIFIDSILKHVDINFADIEDFLARVDLISRTYNIDFVVSLSANREEIGPCVDKYEVLN